MPVLNGVNHIEELIFTAGLGVAVSGGTFVGVPVHPVTPAGYTTDITAVLGVSAAQTAAIPAQYPLSAYPSPDVAFATLVSDANFACPALQVDRWTARRVATFAYQFNDDNAPERFAPLPPAATHSSELQYIFDQPEHATPRHAQRRSADAGRPHARGVGELRRRRQPVDTNACVAFVQPGRIRDVAGATGSAGLGGLCRGSQLRALGHSPLTTTQELRMITSEQTLDVKFRTVDGVRIRYADSGVSREPTVLLTSPWPESVYAFAAMWSRLAEQARLFAIDLPGFGGSNAATISYHRERWASSSPRSSSRPIWAGRTSSRPTWEPPRPCLRLRRIPSGSPA